MVREIILINTHNKKLVSLSENICLMPELGNEPLENNNISFFLIDSTSNFNKAQESITKLRNEINPSVYLRPIVVIVSDKNKNIYGVDESVNIDEINKKTLLDLDERFEPINQWINNAVIYSSGYDTGLMYKILRFIVSRGEPLKPVVNMKSLYGYSYPLLEAITNQDDTSLFSVFDSLEKQRLLEGEFFTKSYFCCYCECAYLNFKETCPHCKSEDLVEHELIHHFKCAYVGEYMDFVRSDELVCPKCDKKLKHIGVDYDKPSVMLHCNQCNNRFQEAVVMTQCFNCGRSIEPEYQKIRTIKSYKSTTIGKNVAIYGMESLFSKMLSPKSNLFKLIDFKNFLLIEVERIKRYQKTTTSLAFVYFDIENIYHALGDNSKNLFHEISELFISLLRKSDVLTSINESLFSLLLIETKLENAQIALSRFEREFHNIMDHNIGHKVEFKFCIEEVNGDVDFDSKVEVFLKENVYR